MLIVGIDPHKQSHTAAVLDRSSGEFLGEKTIPSTAKGYRDLLTWLERMTVDLVAIENVRGLGQHLAAWLAGRGYAIVDVTTKEVGPNAWHAAEAATRTTPPTPSRRR